LKRYNPKFVNIKVVAMMKYAPPGIDVPTDVVKPSRAWRREMM
jgi:hypothetical protein